MFTLLDGHKPSNRASEPIRSTVVSSSWKWDNVPFPEPHLAALLAGGALHVVRPWRLPGGRWWYALAGWPLVGAGVAISASAVRAVAVVELERPTTIVTTGPYARSRNPMYLGWTLLYLGTGLAARNAWMIAALPVVIGAIHREVLREEQALERVFGPAYVRYRTRVRRYL